MPNSEDTGVSISMHYSYTHTAPVNGDRVIVSQSWTKGFGMKSLSCSVHSWGIRTPERNSLVIPIPHILTEQASPAMVFEIFL
jgi:hypothetical protein